MKYGDYDYPKWAEIMGLCISFSSMVWVPGYAIYYVLSQPGTMLEVRADRVEMERAIISMDEQVWNKSQPQYCQKHALKCFKIRENMWKKSKDAEKDGR